MQVVFADEVADQRLDSGGVGIEGEGGEEEDLPNGLVRRPRIRADLGGGAGGVGEEKGQQAGADEEIAPKVEQLLEIGKAELEA